MKKFLFGFTAAALAAVMCVGLVGCGGGPDAKSVKGEKITEEQWNACLDVFEKEDSKYTVEISVEGSGEAAGNKMSADITLTAIKNGPKASLTMDSVEEANGQKAEEHREGVSELKDGKYTLYEKKDGKWTSTESGGPVVTLDAVLMITGINLGSMRFSDYKYDADQKGYVLANAPAGMPTPVIKFNKDGQLIAVYEEYNVDAEGVKSESEINIVITYEAEDITIPTVG